MPCCAAHVACPGVRRTCIAAARGHSPFRGRRARSLWRPPCTQPLAAAVHAAFRGVERARAAKQHAVPLPGSMSAGLP
eukprot:358130-Chlamydomonas_euryale.AAC.10